MKICRNCNSEVFLTDPSTKCDGCNHDFHLSCFDVPQEEILRIRQVNSKYCKLFCQVCSTREDKLDTLFKLIVELKSDFSTRLDALEKRISAGEFNITDEIKEDIINESLERFKRASNIIVFGVPENTVPDDDRKICSSIIDSVLNREYGPVQIRAERLGKMSDLNKPRPIKVYLPNSQIALSILKNKSKLASGHLKKYRISDDKTSKQLAYLNGLRERLKDQISSGNNSLTIKYVNGIPSIVQKKNL